MGVLTDCEEEEAEVFLALAEDETLAWDFVISEDSFCFFDTPEVDLEDKLLFVGLDEDEDEEGAGLLESFEVDDVFLVDDASEILLSLFSLEVRSVEEELLSTGVSSMSSTISSTVTKSSRLNMSSSKTSESS